jgi:hypothetical protein
MADRVKLALHSLVDFVVSHVGHPAKYIADALVGAFHLDVFQIPGRSASGDTATPTDMSQLALARSALWRISRRQA